MPGIPWLSPPSRWPREGCRLSSFPGGRACLRSQRPRDLAQGPPLGSPALSTLEAPAPSRGQKAFPLLVGTLSWEGAVCIIKILSSAFEGEPRGCSRFTPAPLRWKEGIWFFPWLVTSPSPVAPLPHPQLALLTLGCPPAPTPGPCTWAGVILLFFFWPLVLPHFSFMMTCRAHEDGPLGLRQTLSGTVSSPKEMALVFPINCLGSGPPSLSVRDPEPGRRGVGGPLGEEEGSSEMVFCQASPFTAVPRPVFTPL